MIICSRRLQQTTFSDAFFLGALRAKIHDWYMMFQPNTIDVRNKISVLECIKDLRCIILV